MIFGNLYLDQKRNLTRDLVEHYQRVSLLRYSASTVFVSQCMGNVQKLFFLKMKTTFSARKIHLNLLIIKREIDEMNVFSSVVGGF